MRRGEEGGGGQGVTAMVGDIYRVGGGEMGIEYNSLILEYRGCRGGGRPSLCIN